MHLRVDSRTWIVAIGTLLLILSGSPVRADDPPPQDPTMRVSGSGTVSGSGNPVVASQDGWDQSVALIEALYPCSDYSTICAYALSLFNLLPPDYVPPSPCAPSPTCPPPAPPSTVADAEAWSNAAAYIESVFGPVDEATIEYWALEWWNLVPPPACLATCPPPACPGPICTPACPGPTCTPACPAPSCPPPTCPDAPQGPAVATDTEWAFAVAYLLEVVGPIEDATIASFALAWWNILPPPPPPSAPA